MEEKYVFIDRDGVVNKDLGGGCEHGYVTEWKDFHFLPGVLDAIKLLADNGFKSAIISNQQCVGKGYLTERVLEDITQKMTNEIENAGGAIAGCYYCVHLKEENCRCRKPKEGLFHKAQEELNIRQLKDKFFIGDSEQDVLAGKKAGLKTILVLSGKSSKEDAGTWQVKPDHICEDLLEAAKIIVG